MDEPKLKLLEHVRQCLNETLEHHVFEVIDDALVQRVKQDLKNQFASKTAWLHSAQVVRVEQSKEDRNKITVVLRVPAFIEATIGAAGVSIQEIV